MRLQAPAPRPPSWARRGDRGRVGNGHMEQGAVQAPQTDPHKGGHLVVTEMPEGWSVKPARWKTGLRTPGREE